LDNGAKFPVNFHLFDTSSQKHTLVATLTGTHQFNEFLARQAKAMGYVLKPGQLTRGKRVVPIQSEAHFFALLGLREIPPEYRSFARGDYWKLN